MVWVLLIITFNVERLTQDSLHLNEEGNSFLVKHFINFLKIRKFYEIRRLAIVLKIQPTQLVLRIKKL